MSSNNLRIAKPTRIMGGMFGLEIACQQGSPPDTKPQILAGPHLRLITARAAFTLLAQTLRPNTVWLPSFLCGVVKEAFVASNTKVRFFAIREDLQIANEAWITEVQAGDIVVFIDYFGHNTWDQQGESVKQRGAWVVEGVASD